MSLTATIALSKSSKLTPTAAPTNCLFFLTFFTSATCFSMEKFLLFILQIEALPHRKGICHGFFGRIEPCGFNSRIIFY